MTIKELFYKKEKSLGEKGEDLAVKYLKKKGYTIFERNWRNKKGYQIGEIDIIAQKEGRLIFVEVKSGKLKKEECLLEERITPEKLRKLERISQEYLYYKDKQQCEYQFDAVLVYIREENAQVKHIENIFV